MVIPYSMYPILLNGVKKHIDIVNVLVFIAYRAAVSGAEFDYYAGSTKIDVGEIAYSLEFDEKQRQHKVIDIQSTDIMMKIREKYPDFDANGYLNGTERPDTFKWFFAHQGRSEG